MPVVLNIIVAAGTGSRFGGDLPKQFCLLGGRPVLHHSIERMRAGAPGSVTAVVLSGRMAGRVELPAGCIVVEGGATRWESVRNAIEATSGIDADVITVHDAARPLVPREVVGRVIDACSAHDGAIPVVPLADSLRHVTDGAVDRSLYRAVQTPQGFRAALLRRAYELPYRAEFTDDASVMSAAGFADIALVDGAPSGFKITLPLDLEIARLYLDAMTDE